jgi:hypothetical protein
LLGDPRPWSLTRASSNLDDHDEDTKRRLLSDSPAFINHATATNEALDPVANPLLAHSRLPSADPHAIPPPEGSHAVDRATIQVPSPLSSSSRTPVPPSGEVGTGPPEVAANVFGNEEALIHASAPHVAIDVGSPTGLEQSEVVEVADAGDGAPEREGQARSEDVVVGIDSPI